MARVGIQELGSLLCQMCRTSSVVIEFTFASFLQLFRNCEGRECQLLVPSKKINKENILVLTARLEKIIRRSGVVYPVFQHVHKDTRLCMLLGQKVGLCGTCCSSISYTLTISWVSVDTLSCFVTCRHKSLSPFKNIFPGGRMFLDPPHADLLTYF